MNNWLYLTPDGVAEPSPSWPGCLWHDSGERQPGTLAELGKALEGHAVHVLLPVEICTWLRTEKWPGTRKPDARAIAFAVEEQLGEELERLHLCIGTRDGEGRYPVMAIRQDWFRALLSLFDEMGIEVLTVHIDADLLPEDSPCVAWWFGRWMIGGASDARLALCDVMLENLKPLLPADLRRIDLAEGGESFSKALLRGKAINLLQGDFRRTRRQWPWATAAMVLIALFTLAWGSTEVRSGFLEREAEHLYRQSVERFKTLYPEQTRIVDLSAQLNALQRQAGVSQGTQSGRLVELTEQVIGASSVEVQRLEFRAGDGWKIQLTAASFAALEQLRERAQKTALPIKIGGASKTPKGVQAVLTLEDKS